MTLAKRILLGTILISLGWGIAIFLIDHLWGDAAAMWVGVLYPVILGSVIGLTTTRMFITHPVTENEA